MDTEEIEWLCASLSYTDVNRPIVHITGDVHREGVREVSKEGFVVWTVVKIPENSKDSWGKFLRVKVYMDVMKPLLKGFWVRLDEFDIMVVALIEYERLPEFFLGYRYLRHYLKDCDNEATKNEALEGLDTEYGLWLKAATLELLKFHN
ncbi:hypothetical protein ACOSQ2_027374 [Xanthoceras sorbifolium]